MSENVCKSVVKPPCCKYTKMSDIKSQFENFENPIEICIQYIQFSSKKCSDILTIFYSICWLFFFCQVIFWHFHQLLESQNYFPTFLHMNHERCFLNWTVKIVTANKSVFSIDPSWSMELLTSFKRRARDDEGLKRAEYSWIDVK